DLLYGESSGVDHLGVGGGLEWGDRTGRIPQIPLGYLARKGGKANTRILVFQLLIAAKRPLVGAGGEEDLEVGRREHDGAHVPAVRDQARGLRKSVLPGQQSGSQGRPGGYA